MLADSKSDANYTSTMAGQPPEQPPSHDEYLAAWVGHFEVTGERIPVGEVIDTFRRFDRWATLVLLSKMGRVIESPSKGRETQRWLVHGFLSEHLARPVLEKLQERNTVAFHRLQLLNAIRLCLAFAPQQGGQQLSSDADLWTLGKTLLVLNDHLDDHSEDKPTASREALREQVASVALRSLLFNSRSRFAYELMRYLWLYPRLTTRLQSSKRGRTIQASVRNYVGVDLGTLVSVAFGLLPHWPDLKPDDVGCTNTVELLDLHEYFKLTKVARRATAHVVDWLSQAEEDAAATIRSGIRIDRGEPLKAYELLPIKHKPLIQKDGRFVICLDRPYLMERITRGAYWTIFDGLPSADRDVFASCFGEVIDRYSRMLLRRIFRQHYRRPVLTRGGRREVSDGIVVYDRNVVVFEIKTGHLLLRTQQTGDLASYRRDLEKIVVKAASQLSEAIEAVRMRALKLPGLRIGQEVNYHPVLVTAEEFPVFFPLSEIIDEEIQKAGHLAGRRIARLTIMQLEDLELMEPVIDRAKFFALLKRRHGDVRLRNTSFKNFIHETVGSPLPENTWMRKEYAKATARIKRRLFGRELRVPEKV